MDTDEDWGGMVSRQMTKEESFVYIKSNLLHSFWYKGGFYNLCNVKDYFGDANNILMWINDYIPKTKIVTNNKVSFGLAFRTKEDLMAFKLRWIL